MKLYYTPGACSLIERIIINEIGIDCDFELVNLKDKKTETGQDYLQINSKGAVPALVLNNGTLLTENAVLLQYLADETKSTNLLPPVNDMKRYQVLEWLNYATTELHKGFSPLFNPKMPDEVKNDVLRPQLVAKFKFINAHLEQNTFLMGDTLTLPDAYVFVMLLWAHKFELPIGEFKALKRYFDELYSRKAFKQSLEEEHLI